MIKWTFFFDKDNISALIDEEEEDIRILTSLDSSGILEVPKPNEKIDLYVNMALVKCSARQVVDGNPAGSQEAVVQNEAIGSN